MLTARPGETVQQLKARMMATNDAAPYQSQGRPNESRKGNWKFPGTGSGDTQDAENAVSVGTLPPPDDGSHYELRDLETGEIEICLISDMPDQEPTPPNQTADRIHRLHATNGDSRLRKMNRDNKAFWAKLK